MSLAHLVGDPLLLLLLSLDLHFKLLLVQLLSNNLATWTISPFSSHNLFDNLCFNSLTLTLYLILSFNILSRLFPALFFPCFSVPLTVYLQIFLSASRSWHHMFLPAARIIRILSFSGISANFFEKLFVIIAAHPILICR